MPSIQRSLTINAPTERVFDAFVDLSGWLAWNPHFKEVKSLSEGPLAKGSKARVALKRSPFSSVWQVTELNPGRSFAWESSSLPGLRLSFDHIAEDADDGTRATLRVDIEGPLAFLSTFAGAFYGRNLDHSLNALKRMLEGEASPTTAPEQQEPPAEESPAEPTSEVTSETEKETAPETEPEPNNQ